MISSILAAAAVGILCYIAGTYRGFQAGFKRGIVIARAEMQLFIYGLKTEDKILFKNLMREFAERYSKGGQEPPADSPQVGGKR